MKPDYEDWDYILNNYPEIPTADVKEDYIIDYYDGPIAGILTWRDSHYYYMWLHDKEFSRYNPDCNLCEGKINYTKAPTRGTIKCHKCHYYVACFGIYKLKPEVLDKENFWQSLFLTCVENSNLDPIAFTSHQAIADFYYCRHEKDYVATDVTKDSTPVGYIIGLSK